MKDFIEDNMKEVCTREHRTVEEVILLKMGVHGLLCLVLVVLF